MLNICSCFTENAQSHTQENSSLVRNEQNSRKVPPGMRRCVGTGARQNSTADAELVKMDL